MVSFYTMEESAEFIGKITDLFFMVLPFCYNGHFYNIYELLLLKKKKKAKNPNETTTKKQRKEFKDCLGDQPFKAKD